MAYQFNNLWLGIVLWLLFYISDYSLTLAGNRLRTKYAQSYIEISGSYEINPILKKDVDAFRRISPRFMLLAAFYVIWLIGTWLLADATKIPEIFTVAFGFIIVPQLAVMIEHFNNISTFNLMKIPGSVEGRIKYAYWMTRTLAIRRFGYWTLVCAVLFGLTGSWIFIGGALGCFRTYVRFSLVGPKLPRQTA